MVKILLCLGLFCLAPSLIWAGGLWPHAATTPTVTASPQQSQQIALTLNSRPPVLPADGGSYNSLALEFMNLTTGMPYIPTNSITISMTSSDPQAGIVPSSIMFPAGTLFVNTHFNTTTTPGNATISAFASGYLPANLNMSTQKVGGIPSALDVFLSPNQIPPDKKLNSNVVVQAVDAFGLPVKLSSDTTIFLSSSNSQIGTVPTSVVISAGQSFAQTLFQPTYLPGQAIITASAPGFAAGSNIIATVGPIAGKVVVSVAPFLISTDPNDEATVSIQLQDINQQTPAIASSNVNVVMSSSNTSVAQVVSSNVIIPAGASYASVQVKSGGFAGQANITAAAQGYMKSAAAIQTLPVVQGVLPTQLSLSFAPKILLPNQMQYPSAVTVELQYLNATSHLVSPATSTSDIVAYVRSSNNQSMFVNPLALTIPAGTTHASTYVNSTYLPGTAHITAQSQGLAPDTQTLNSSGLIPDALFVQFTPSILLSGGTYNSSIIVGLKSNATGEPAKAPIDTVVTLTSTSPSLVGVQHFVIIKAGQTFAVASLTTSYGATGGAVVVASATSYISSNSTVSLVMPAASSIGIYSVPTQLVANNQSYAAVAVQLQDSAGKPQKTDVPVRVQLSTQSLTLGSITSIVTIPPGQTFVLANVTTTLKPGPIDVSAFANGFKPGNATMSSILFPLSARLQISSVSLFYNGKANITLYVQSFGSPIQSAAVTWHYANSYYLTNAVNSTDSSGRASASYRAGLAAGIVTLFANVTKPGFTPASANATIRILNPNPQTNTTQTDQGGILGYQVASVPIVIIVPIIAAAAVGSFFFIRRKRSGGRASEDDDDMSDEEV